MNKLALVIIFVIGVLFYGLTMHGLLGNPQEATIDSLRVLTSPFESSHERASYSQMITILDKHEINISQTFADFSVPDVGFYKGKFYSYFPPGISVLIMPLYLLGYSHNLGLLFAFSTIPIIAIFSMLLIFQICRKIFELPIWASCFAVFTYAFATTSWNFSVTIYQHGPTVFLLLLCFYSAWKYKARGRFSWLWAIVVWAGYGLSLYLDYPNAVLLAPIMIYFLFAAFSIENLKNAYKFTVRWSILFTAVVFVLISASLLYYNYYNFGSVRTFTNTLPGYTIKNYSELQGIDTVTVAQEKSEVGNIFSERRIFKGLFELTVAKDKGLFVFCPILILGFLGMLVYSKQLSGEAGAMMGVVFTDILVYSSFVDPWGGYSFGPRYLIPAMSMLSIFAAIWVSRQSYAFLRRLLAFILYVASAAIAIIGVLTTSMTPPSVEAIPQNEKYGLSYNLDFIRQGKSASILYNNYLFHNMTLEKYFLYILSLLALVAFITLFIIPYFEKHETGNINK